MSSITVLLATNKQDLQADGLAAALAESPDFRLLERKPIGFDGIGPALKKLDGFTSCALVLVGPPAATRKIAVAWSRQRPSLVVLRVDVTEGSVKLDLHDPGMEAIISILRQLVSRFENGGSGARISRTKLRQGQPINFGAIYTGNERADRPLLSAAIAWTHELLRSASMRLIKVSDKPPGILINTPVIADHIEFAARPEKTRRKNAPLNALEATLTKALELANPEEEPLAAVCRALKMTVPEFKLLLLALSPEFDARNQRLLILMGEGRLPTGSYSLYAELLDQGKQARLQFAETGCFSKWLLVDSGSGELPHADEAFRIDPPLRDWLLGASHALLHDVKLNKFVRTAAWPGASFAFGEGISGKVTDALTAAIHNRGAFDCWVLSGGHVAGWRAVLESQSASLGRELLRIDSAFLANLQLTEIRELANRLARAAVVLKRPVVIDASSSAHGGQHDITLSSLFFKLRELDCKFLTIGAPLGGAVRLLENLSYGILEDGSLGRASAVAVKAAAGFADVELDSEAADRIAHLYPLSIDRLENASRLAKATPGTNLTPQDRYQGFVAACKEVSADGLSNLTERIEPSFSLDDVVLPRNQLRELNQIVTNVRLANAVFDGWNFRQLMPHGRGVTALFHGPSGTGKTMAAFAIANRLSIQILKVDLSRVVSKYVGDTEKNLDRVFNEAQVSRCALLIDEADALMGKRSEVTNAHDRYANLEVAYLLQRMESFDGLVILTSNLRQSLDSAFSRRLRFIIDFPRPDHSAREAIWRNCLPAGTHEINDAQFRQLARKIELTGGHVRQITLRSAFAAASSKSKINIGHITEACGAELAKLGLPPITIPMGAAA